METSIKQLFDNLFLNKTIKVIEDDCGNNMVYCSEYHTEDNLDDGDVIKYKTILSYELLDTNNIEFTFDDDSWTEINNINAKLEIQ